ncbi:MAG TPA: ferritin-like domain-containing protein [Cytophagales bacterium]|nr:ferritin-like domain-containing protein [Cytophagales bacterium]
MAEKSRSSASSGSQNKNQAVKAKSGAADNLRSLLEDQLKDIYWAEKALTKAIPQLIENATSEELIDVLSEHLTETEDQIERLDQVFKKLGVKAEAKKCEAMAGLIKEAESIIEETQPGEVRDAGIIAAAQKVEHYEIASYGTLAAFAKTLGEDEILDLLVETLEEEKNADSLLTEIAESYVNEEASEEDGE